MAVGHAFFPLDMSAKTVWFGNLVDYTASRIEIQLGGQRTVYEGQFTYNLFTGAVSGVMNAVYEWNGADLLYQITGASADAALVYNAVQIQGNWGLSASILLAGRDRLTGSSGDDDIAAFGGKDRVNGGGGDDVIRGYDGNDTLKGGAGDDMLFGDLTTTAMSGRDRLFGGSGSDTLNGGNGNDELTGGKGRDTFIFSPGHDTVTDFAPIDKIDMRAATGITGFRDLVKHHATQVGADVMITDGTSNTMLLLDTQLGDLRPNDFLF